MSDAEEQRITVERVGALTVHVRDGVDPKALVGALGDEGAVLKSSRKSRTTRVGEWVVKSSVPGAWVTCKQSVQRERCRQAWNAALHLERTGVSVAKPLAYVERQWFGLLSQYWFVSEYLDGCVDVEAYADSMIERDGAGEELAVYLGRLAGAVDVLCGCGAYHNDLAGKNILTCDGKTFYFIDLDGIVIGRTYTDALRMKNHVQLYDSFLDRLDDVYLVPFVRTLYGEDGGFEAWMEEVRRLQVIRRARTEAIWRVQGKKDF